MSRVPCASSALAAARTTSVASVSALFAATGSGAPPVTLADVVSGPDAEGLTVAWTVIVALPGNARGPREHVSVPAAWVHVGAPGLDDTKETWPGSVPITVMPGDVAGPLFATWMVQVSTPPWATGSGASDNASERSACATAPPVPSNAQKPEWSTYGLPANGPPASGWPIVASMT